MGTLASYPCLAYNYTQYAYAAGAPPAGLRVLLPLGPRLVAQPTSKP